MKHERGTVKIKDRFAQGCTTRFAVNSSIQ